ncbi:hypothetical protein OPT61_g1447 [Boeremia exigua]|uniref:Uncharacterized protein n=1 Tax=Boeremia exigua TaxID=749465 RepID=A0ACC2IQ56_9PLEO|nr:hypothetical protein OPT61_g1447 [Boeremia exigua]
MKDSGGGVIAVEDEVDAWHAAKLLRRWDLRRPRESSCFRMPTSGCFVPVRPAQDCEWLVVDVAGGSVRGSGRNIRLVLLGSWAAEGGILAPTSQFASSASRTCHRRQMQK